MFLLKVKGFGNISPVTGSPYTDGVRWHMPVNPTTPEAEAEGSQFEASLELFETLSQN